jgi:D-alanyl-D-alanine-carboxypeptidase/D-alanyl-D-alanine-endopeptidase
MSRLPAGLLLLLLLAPPATAQAPAGLPDQRVRDLVAARVADSMVPGLALGRIRAADTLQITQGRRRVGAAEPVTPSTGFEIGSITKVFTGLLLADMVLRGEVSLDDPVSRFVPPGTTVPERDGVAITLRHLTTHTSGLPRLPDNMAPANPEDPYRDYDPARLFAFLSGHQLRRAPGAQYEYSNLGAGLLGWILASRSGMSYEALLRRRILEPLGMRETGIADSEWSRRELASGHDPMGIPTSAWHFDAMAGAGAIRASLEDMLRFAGAARDTVRGPLARAMALSQREAFRVDSVTSVGLGWHRRTRGGRTIVWHNGGTGGFRTILVADAGHGEAGVVLTNSSHSSDGLGFALLDSLAPVTPIAARRPTVQVDPAILRRYPGQYALSPSFIITITARDSTGLDLQATGQPRIRLHASSPVDFFVVGIEASITFEVDPSGRAVAQVLHQNGAHQRASRQP